MLFTVATWNINSIRLRLPLVLDYLSRYEPDVLCLQETKCPDDQFPLKALQALGYEHCMFHGQKGYHGVATLARHPLTLVEKRRFCEMADCRHIAVKVAMGSKALRIDNFYVPAGGDVPDPEENPKFRHKLAFLEEMRAFKAERADGAASILVGDLNIAPLEHDVWSHRQLLKIVSHTPIETQMLQNLCNEGGWVDLMRVHTPETQKLYTWWSYRAKDWQAADRGRRLDHIWASKDLLPLLAGVEILTQARGWERPSDHVPVLARFHLP
ncbi:exodeoxyribonuclease III [Bartonella sp. DGB2]|uniref:exodeoxyribonuclease III n=1 Tax=Bartonella sp. DGB2 TaxID=3388426 RepID=UPI00398FBF83